MNDNDPVMKMYEAQAIALEKEQELEQKTKELEAALREIERLRAKKKQNNINEAITLEQTFNTKFLEMDQKFEDLYLLVSNLQKENDKKFEELQKDNIKLNDKTGVITTKLLDISSKLETVYSEFNQYTSIMLLGGEIQSDISDLICIYNSQQNKWNDSHFKLPYKLASHGSVILKNKIYVFGGCDRKNIFKDCYKFRENGEWIKLADMNEKRANIGNSSVIFDDEIWVFGGNNETNLHKTIEKYNPKSNTWTVMSEMNTEKFALTVSIINGKFYISGGYDGRNPLKAIEVYDPEANSWEIFCEMPFALDSHASVMDGTNLIIIGGQKSDNKPSNEVWKIDTLDPEKKWIKMPNLQEARYDHGAVKLSNGLMIIGGKIDQKTQLDSVEIFDGNDWIKEDASLPEMRGTFSLIPLTSKDEKILLQQFCDN